MAVSRDPPFETSRHLKYLKMCYDRPLPHHYLSNETNRVALAYFMLMAIDIVTPSSAAPESSLNGHIQASEADKAKARLILPAHRAKLRKWILAHQHPMGGFCGSPSTTLPSWHEDWDFETRKPTLEKLGHAQLPATKFALQMLAMLAEDDTEAAGAFRHVDRRRTLMWLKRLQREDGSFGEHVAEIPDKGWVVGGGYDMRHCYLASSVRWMLRGDAAEGDRAWVEDIDIDRLVKHISRSQTYDGGLAQSSSYEPHAGYAYCAIAALSLLDRPLEGSNAFHPSKALQAGIRSIPKLAHWLASRQFAYLDPGDDDEEDDPDNFTQPLDLSVLSLEDSLKHVGFNGRSNKVADTCYCWWVGASLDMLGHTKLLQRDAARRFMLEKTAHPIVGGFGKGVGSPPDVYHTFLALSALTILGEPALKEFDASLVVTAETARKIEQARRGMLRPGAPTVSNVT